jgi:hypothetical protein
MSPYRATRCIAWVMGVTLANDCESLVVAFWQPPLIPKHISPPMPTELCAGVWGAA